MIRGCGQKATAVGTRSRQLGEGHSVALGKQKTQSALSPNDEFADYGTWDKGSFGPEPKTRDMLLREYPREAL